MGGEVKMIIDDAPAQSLMRYLNDGITAAKPNVTAATRL